MNFNTMKQIIQRSIDSYSFSEKDAEKNRINRIILGVLLYDILNQLLAIDTSYNTNIVDSANSYATTLKGTVQSLEGKYISYKSMTKFIKKNNIQNFISITITQVNSILSLYHDKRTIEKFSIIHYSSRMYSVPSLTFTQSKYLEKVHNKIMVPIVKYYIMMNNISESDVLTESVLDNNPGKIIHLSISTISPNRIITDINNGKIGIQSSITSVSLTPDGLVEIII